MAPSAICVCAIFTFCNMPLNYLRELSCLGLFLLNLSVLEIIIRQQSAPNLITCQW